MKTLVETMLRAQRQAAPDLGLTFLVDGAEREAFISYGELALRARAVGSTLAERAGVGARVLLLYPPGLDFLVGFFGCLSGGCVAVPVYPPDPMRLGRTLPRLQLIAQDAGAEVVMTTEAVQSMFSFVLDRAPELARMTWVCSDEVERDAAAAWSMPDIGADTLAFLQYTSGSTSAPRGVMVSHGNLLHNLALMNRCFDNQPEQSHAVNWLPLYHDMGLIGAILQPMFALHPGTFMSPLAFLSNPVLWLKAISRHRGTHCGGPDFGYHLCTRRVKEAELAELDLSCWRLAFDGAEPVRADTLRRFSERFSVCGFKPEAFYPCYGLAEATLFVSGGPIEARARILRLDPEAIERGEVREVAPGSAGREVVGAGLVHPEAPVRIVDPGAEDLIDLDEDRIGEILVSGGSVAEGYWSRSAEVNEAVFKLEGWLRTGDLGFVREGTLFVMGRLKDLIILRGRNHYPQDLEQSAELSHPGLRTGCAAAFAVEVDGNEVAVVAIEARGAGDAEAIAEAVRRAVLDEHDVPLHAVVLLEPRTVPKTSSGKIQRYACRRGFLDGSLSVIGARVFEQSEAVPGPIGREALDALAPEAREGALLASLRAVMGALVGSRAERVDPDGPLASAGMDSLSAAELQHHLRSSLGAEVKLGELLGEGSLRDLARQLLSASPENSSARLAARPRGSPMPLSFQQARSWGFDRLLEAGTFRFHVSGAYHLEGRIDPSALGECLRQLGARHESLRTRFVEIEGEPAQVFDPEARFDLSLTDLRGLDEAQRRQAQEDAARTQASEAFSLSEDALVRVHLLWTAPDEGTLLVTLHHIIADAASVAVFIEELAALYDARLSGTPSGLPPIEVQFADFAAWQRQELGGDALGADLAHWRARFEGHPASLQLDIDTTDLDALPTTDSAHRTLAISPAQCQALRALARAQGATLTMTLFAAYQAVLHSFTPADDMLFDTVFAGRTRPELSRMIGFVAENLVLRADLSSDPTFEALLSQVRHNLLDAYDRRAWRSLFHTDPTLREIMISPVCFNMQPPTFEERIELPSITIRPLPELTRRLMVHCLGAILYVFEQGQGLHFDLVANRALFDDAWSDAFMSRLAGLLDRAPTSPEARLSRLLT